MTIGNVGRILPAILAALFVLAAGPAQAEIKKGWIDYGHGTKKLKGYVVHDDARNGRRPAILMIHAREGMTQKTQGLTEMWATLGYVAFAADVFGYGEGLLPKNVDEMSAQTKIYRTDRALTRARVQAGWDALVKHPLVDAGRIAAIGYCFGGDVGLEFGSTGAPLALNVAIHGSFEKKYPDGWAKNVKGRFLILHGAEDVGYPMTTVQTVIDDLRVAKVPFQYEVYSGASHGFSTPKGRDNERANTQSIASTARNLREVFGD
jgi:dienelactone hydrolase